MIFAVGLLGNQILMIPHIVVLQHHIMRTEIKRECAPDVNFLWYRTGASTFVSRLGVSYVVLSAAGWTETLCA